ncbi:MAG: carboxymuconolactone decarboxylase family protein [Anaerolineales bacterium]|nr:carboxymuconolactone decarboxylase family protein [Anaerolineales bacterium]
MTVGSEFKHKYYEWSNEVFSRSPFDPKTTHILCMVAALALGNEGAVSYFYFSAKKAGASEAELAAATDIATATVGLNLYTLLPKD